MDSSACLEHEAGQDSTQVSPIDVAVLGRLKKLGIQPSPVCPDSVFVRRVFLDAIGTLPTSAEVRAFLSDARPNKRSALVDQVLAREEFPDYWAMKWSDILRVKSEFPVNLWPLAAEAYHRWIRDALKENWTYDRFARALLLASGSNFRNPEVNFYRAMPAKDLPSITKTVALTFMGARAEKWPKARLDGMAAFFSQVGYKATGEWKEEIVFSDPAKETGRPQKGLFPDGTSALLPLGKDPRQVFVDWLVSPKNSWFARNIVNRAWFWLMGRGIIHEPDDIRPDNPARNPELLATLEAILVREKYDLKRLFRAILNSTTYQRSAIPADKRKEAADEFAHYRVRRLEAEVLIDAIDQITGTRESYFSMTPEPFTFIPETQRSIALADGSVSTSFLEMFGRPPRDTGFESERNNRPTAAQRLHLLNSSHIQGKIEKGAKVGAMIRLAKSSGDLVDEVYLVLLSRFPSPEEKKIALDHLGNGSADRNGAIDIVWAALNSSEFQYRH